MQSLHHRKGSYILCLGYLFRTVTFKHGIVYNKNIGTVFRIQWKNSVVYDSGCKDCSKTHPVNLNHLHETIHGIFCKIRCIFSSKQTHIHTSVGENQQKHVLKNLRYRNAFPFIGIDSFQG